MSYANVNKKTKTLSRETWGQKIKRLLPFVVREQLPREVGIIEISARESRRLNLIYRQREKPANVLSFRYGKDYGEILVCPEVIRREAKEQGNSYKYQMTWMILHGILHLAGMHHEKSQAMRKKFERIEKSMLRKLF